MRITYVLNHHLSFSAIRSSILIVFVDASLTIHGTKMDFRSKYSNFDIIGNR